MIPNHFQGALTICNKYNEEKKTDEEKEEKEKKGIPSLIK